jgi:cell division protein FtsN
MRNNDTGEFELVVGNRQLLSGFFIVVLLFAVAFAMGYVVGQNSPRSSKLTGETAAASTPVPVPAPDSARQSPAPSQPAAVNPPADAPAQQPAAAPETPAPQQPIAPPARDTAAAPDAGTTDASAPPALAPGTYWQAMAVQQHEAEVMAAGLKEKGLPVVLTPGTKGLTRVLVGPYTDKTTLGRAKTELENAGIHPILFK